MEAELGVSKTVTVVHEEIDPHRRSRDCEQAVDTISVVDPPLTPSTTSFQSKPRQQPWSKRHIHKWKSPLLNVGFFIFGFAMSLAHCVFYPKLKDRVVGDSSAQEEKLRFGTAFSFLAQASLSASVWTTYTQWLWRTVRRKELEVRVLNWVFGADTSVLSLLHWDMISNFRVGSVMALLAWSLLLPPFFTPATLFIYPSVAVAEVQKPMPYPSIADSKAGHAFAYSPPILRDTMQYQNDTSRAFTGPRTILNTIATATASLGEILAISSPYNSSEYSMTFFAPIIKCQEANSSTAGIINQYLEEELATRYGDSIETDSAYYSFVPTYNSSGGMIPVSTPRQQSPSNAANELWMTFLRPVWNSTGARIKQRHFQTCVLHNASYDLTVTHDHGFQNMSKKYEILEPVPFPSDTPGMISNMAQHAYSAFMWSITDQLVGKFAWYEEVNPSSSASSSRPSQYGALESAIQRTSLLGSLDLDAYFDLDEERGLYRNQNLTLGDQRLMDKRMARNRTLDVLIEELSFNVSVGLMRDTLLTHTGNTTIRITNDVNRYSYHAIGLFVPYALANLFTLITVLVGSFSYLHDDVMPDKKFQDIVSAAEDPDLVRVVRERKRSVTAVVVDGKVVLRAGVHERGGKMEVWRKVRRRVVKRRPASKATSQEPAARP